VLPLPINKESISSRHSKIHHLAANIRAFDRKFPVPETKIPDLLIAVEGVILLWGGMACSDQSDHSIISNRPADEGVVRSLS
jgi:hypothetical protein